MEVREFPIKTQIGTFNNEADIEAWMCSDDFVPMEYGFIKHSPFIYTDNIQEILDRYSLFKSHGIISYSNNYDEMPSIWVDALILIDSELGKAREMKNNEK